MWFVRLIGLLLLTAFCFGMGSIPSNEANGIAKLFGPMFFVAAPMLYFFPTLEAYLRRHHNLGALAALNVLAGWTLVGWVGALVWALSRPARAEVINDERAPFIPQAATPLASPVAEKECPFCAETIKAAARVCKHCGRDQPVPG